MRDPQLEPYLFTNLGPDKLGLSILAASLERAEIFGGQLDNLASALEVALKRVKDARSAVESSIFRHKGALHPIRSIPDDILFSIFEWCTLMATYDRDALSMVPEDAPWTLSRVSHGWRNLVLSSPSLWSTVNIHPLSFQVGAARRANLLSWLELLLRRSGRSDLHVRVSGTMMDPVTRWPVSDHVLLVTCFQSLRASTSRWRTAELKNVHHGLTSMFTGIVFERLSDLTLTFMEIHGAVVGPVRWYTPNVTRVALTEWAVGMVELSWANVRFFHCQAVSIWHLPSCVALEELVITQVDEESIQVANIQTPVVLPSLHTLSVLHCVPQIPDLLVLPSIITLWLDFDASGSKEYPRFGGAIQRIHNLRLGSAVACGSSVESLLAFLRACVSVRALYVDSGIVNGEVLAALEISEGREDDILLPQMTTLGFAPEVLDLFPHGLLDLVLSRSGEASRSLHRLTELKVMQFPFLEGYAEGILTRVTEWAPDVMEKWRAVNENVQVTDVYVDYFCLEV